MENTITQKKKKKTKTYSKVQKGSKKKKKPFLQYKNIYISKSEAIIFRKKKQKSNFQ